jgi:hypothetical protein
MNIFLQAFGFAGGGIGGLLSQLEQLGFFSYALPFLILFALIFGVLSRMNLFGTTSKVTNAIVSLAVSLMALQFGFVSQFFSEIFPRLGAGLAVILLILIVVGLANPSKSWNKGVMVFIGVMIVGIILYQTFGANYWYNVGYWWPDNWLTFLIIGLVIFTIGSVIANTPEDRGLKVGPILKNLFSSSEYS